MITEDKIHAVLSKLEGLDLSEWPEVVDEEFVERVRVAHHWSTTRVNRWRLFTRGQLYAIRHSCEYDVKRKIGDRPFAVGAVLAGWHPHRDWLRPDILRFRRAKAEA
jgi:hypothetical protein